MAMQAKHILVLAIMVAPAAVHAAETRWSANAATVAEWIKAANWQSGVPTEDSSVVINHPNPSAYARLRNAPGGVSVARLQVGAGTELDGELRVTSDFLRVTIVDGVEKSGEILVGNSGGNGRVFVKSAGLSCATDLVVGGSADSVGRLKLEAAEILVGGELTIANRDSARGQVAICASSVFVNRLRVGDGQARLQFVARPTIGQLVSTQAPRLGGELVVHVANLADGSDEIVLIRNDSDEPPIGGFDDVLIANPPDRFYELTYSGGDGNDVSIVRAPGPVNEYDTWADLHFPDLADAAKRVPNADPDQDGFRNALEYALGRCPTHNEQIEPDRSEQRVKGQIETSLTYELRTDRTDVMLVPQGKPAGSVWQNGMFSREQSVVGASVSRIVATCTTAVSCETRLVAQLAPTTDSPHVLFVMVDDLNNWLGCLQGHPQARSPNIDQLAARGVLFRQAHAPATACNPSRVAILTGKRPADTGLYRNSTKFREHRLLANAVTIPDHFRKNGYQSIGSGKLFHAEDLASWDTYFPRRTDYNKWALSPDVTPASGITRRGRNFDWGRLGQPEEVTRDYRVTSYVIDRVHELNPQAPRFLACGLFRPHLPFYAPDKYFDLFEDVQLPAIDPTDTDDLPGDAISTIRYADNDAVQEAGQHKNAVHSYLASIAYMDAQVGRLMAALDTSSELRNTIVVLMSDHGFSLGQKSHWRKDSLWHNVTHVPLIVIAPGVTTPGTIVDTSVSLLDVYPTLNDLCGLPERKELSGTSLVPLLRSKDAGREEPALTTRFRRQHSIHDGRYHYLRYANGDEELYDLWRDPREWKNLATDPTMVPVMDRLSQWLPRYNARSGQ